MLKRQNEGCKITTMDEEYMFRLGKEEVNLRKVGDPGAVCINFSKLSSLEHLVLKFWKCSI